MIGARTMGASSACPAARVAFAQDGGSSVGRSSTSRRSSFMLADMAAEIMARSRSCTACAGRPREGTPTASRPMRWRVP
jgi:hypothetical protein